MSRPVLPQVASHQHDLAHGHCQGGGSHRRAAVPVDEAIFDGVRQIAQANALTIVVADPPQGDVRMIWLVPNGKPQPLQRATDVLLQRLQPVHGAMQPHPEDAWPAKVREDAEGRRAQVEGRVRGDDIREGESHQLSSLPLGLAQEVQRQM